jgi:hypothetical protein
MATPAAVAIGVVVGVLLGPLTYGVLALLRDASQLARLIATLALFGAGQAFMVLRWGPSIVQPRPILPSRNVILFGDVMIGLEVHAQLQTASKMFCGCSTLFGALPNTHTCPTCLGLPGALPVPNSRAVDLAAMVALALGCAVSPRSCFARKRHLAFQGCRSATFHRHRRLSWSAAGRPSEGWSLHLEKRRRC